MNSWQTISPVNPDSLSESQLQLQYAIQFIAATGAALAEPLPDYSHTSLMWSPDLEMFVGPVIRASQPFQVALDPTSLTLSVLNQHSEALVSLALHGKTMAEGLDWLKSAIAPLGAEAHQIELLDYPPDDFPDHPLAHGASFNIHQATALGELVTYYANTHSLLETISTIYEDVAAIRIWPHHFDMAVLVMLPGIKDGSLLTVGVGVSPGDASYPEPYWYVTPYPYPDPASLPALEGPGFWHTQHWVGAVFLASHLAENAEDQHQQVEAFLNLASQASILLLKPESVQV